MSISWLRRLHRYLGLVIGVQLLLWTAGGLYFSWNDIDEVRGEKDAAERAGLVPLHTTAASLSAVLADLKRQHTRFNALDSVTLRALLGRLVYEIAFWEGDRRVFALADALTGKLRPPLSQDEAVAVAVADFLPEAPVKSVDYITEVPPGSEYRGRDLPAYRVTFDHPKGTRIYVAAERGLVTARRNNVWRSFDFLWMMHIMDYRDRDDFNTALLRVFSAFGVLTVLSGYGLWGLTRLSRARRSAGSMRRGPAHKPGSR